MAWAKLEISDGTTTVNLIALGTGFHLVDWNPQIIQPKEGGVFQDSPIAPGRRLVFAVDATAIESFDLDLNNEDQNGLIEQSQDLIRLLNKARAYQTAEFQTDPVWIRARAECEDNDRFALVINWAIPNLDNPYAPPFFVAQELATMEDISLQLERGHWAGLRPGSVNTTALSVVEAFNSINLGTVDSSGNREATTNGVYLANKSNVANVSHVYRFDSSAGTFSSNLISAALPYNLYPSPAGNGDILYVGCSTAITDSGPFSNLIFDITQAAAGTHTIIWEYWSGAAWSTLTVRDNTDSGGEFRVLGVNAVSWIQPDNWASTSINGVTAYWVRARISAFTSMGTIPQQGNRDIYSTPWAYVEIQSDIIVGDIPAIVQIKLANQSDSDGLLSSGPDLYLNRAIVGLRSYDRGANFKSFINLSNTQNPSGITVTASAGAVIGTVVNAVTRETLQWNGAGTFPTFASRGTVSFSSTLAPEYYGTYHAYLRATFEGSAAATTVVKGDFIFRLQVRSGTGGVAFNTNSASMIGNLNTSTIYYWQLLDFGEITIPNFDLLAPGDNPDSVTIDIQIKCAPTANGNTVLVQDLILVPVDEWAADCVDAGKISASILGSVSGNRRYLDLDGAVNPKVDVRALIRLLSNDQIPSIWMPITGGQPIAQSNARQRYHFLTASNFVVDGTHTGANGASILTDSAADFIDEGVVIGDIVYNTSNGSSAVISAVTATTISGSLAGGSSENDWDTGDSYYIVTGYYISSPFATCSVQINHNPRYLGLRGSR